MSKASNSHSILVMSRSPDGPSESLVWREPFIWLHLTPSISPLESKHSSFPGHKKSVWFSSSTQQQLPEPDRKLLPRTPNAPSYGEHLDQLLKAHGTDSVPLRCAVVSSQFVQRGPKSPQGTQSRARLPPSARWPSSPCLGITLGAGQTPEMGENKDVLLKLQEAKREKKKKKAN